MKKIHLIISVLLLSCNLTLNGQDKFLTAIPTTSSLIENLPVDIKIKPVSGTASSAQSGSGIEKSFDGNMSTLYHSQHGNVNRFPITLQYNFANTVEQIDYLIYYPRTTGTNGNFKEIEVRYKLQGEEIEKFYKEYNFGGAGTASVVRFEEALVKPLYIKIIVKSGVGDNNGIGFASCAEMEFYQKNSDSFDYLDIFADASCSEIKEGVTEEDIKKIKIEFYKKLAEDIFYGDYDKEFRIQEYQSYPHPMYIADKNKTNPYGRRDNPTGIYAFKGESLVIFAAESAEETYPGILIYKEESKNEGSSYGLQPGLNIITPSHNGLIYVMYYTMEGKEKPVKINIVTGGVNGYFDLAKHNTEDWKRLIKNAPYPYFDMKGKYAILNFETKAYRNYTKDKGVELMQAYDDLVRLEMDFMGLFKYNKAFSTRMHFQVVYGDNHMYATSYYTGYNQGTQKDILDYDKLTSKAYTSGWAGGTAWGPAHEVGHCNQTRPGLKWHGMTEVTNNIHSQFVTTSWQQPSRLNDEVLSTYGNRYNKAIQTIVKAEKPHNESGGDVFCKLVPFWQLKLYIHDVLGNDDFYKDLYEKIRVTPNLTVGKNGNTVDGQYQLNFTKMVCEISGYDFTEFFEDWGFYRSYSSSFDDYGTKTFTVTKAGIEAIKSEIATLNLPKPPVPEGKKLYEITDKNKMEFKIE